MGIYSSLCVKQCVFAYIYLMNKKRVEDSIDESKTGNAFTTATPT